MAELIACIVSVFEFPELFEYKAITFHLDGARCPYGADERQFLGPLILPVSPCPPMLAVLWFEYVGSQPNIADGGFT